MKNTITRILLVALVACVPLEADAKRKGGKFFKKTIGIYRIFEEMDKSLDRHLPWREKDSDYYVPKSKKDYDRTNGRKPIEENTNEACRASYNRGLQRYSGQPNPAWNAYYSMGETCRKWFGSPPRKTTPEASYGYASYKKKKKDYNSKSYNSKSSKSYSGRLKSYSSKSYKKGYSKSYKGWKGYSSSRRYYSRYRR